MHIEYNTKNARLPADTEARFRGLGLGKLIDRAEHETVVVARDDGKQFEIPSLKLSSYEFFVGVFNELSNMPGNSLRLGGVMVDPSVDVVFKGPLAPLHSHLPKGFLLWSAFDSHFNYVAVKEASNLVEVREKGLPVTEQILLHLGNRYKIIEPKGFALKRFANNYRRDNLMSDFDSKVAAKGFKFDRRGNYAGLYQFGINHSSHVLASLPHFDPLKK